MAATDLSLNRTLDGSRGFLADAQKRFSIYLRSEVDGLDDDEEDEVSVAEMDFKFLLRTAKVQDMSKDELQLLGKEFFGVNHKINLDNRYEVKH